MSPNCIPIQLDQCNVGNPISRRQWITTWTHSALLSSIYSTHTQFTQSSYRRANNEVWEDKGNCGKVFNKKNV